MKNYLSFGGGVNSVAMYLLLLDQGMVPGDPDKGFEAVFVDHGTDWPETYEYVEMFKSRYPMTVLKPDEQGCSTLYDYCEKFKILPSRINRWCTDKFKVRVMGKYYKKPCFTMLGIDNGESHRAKISTNKGVELRYPLIEAEINRELCKKLIKKHGLSVPIKSGCYICPFQKVSGFKQLRRTHPELFCRAEKLESLNNDFRKSIGKEPFGIIGRGISLKSIVGENQSKLWAEDEYPPCECML